MKARIIKREHYLAVSILWALSVEFSLGSLLSLAGLQLLLLQFLPNFDKKNLQSSLFRVLHFTTECFPFYFILWHITQFQGYTNNDLSTLNAKEPWHTLSGIRTLDFWWLRNLDSKRWSNCGSLEKLWRSYTCMIYVLRAIKWYTRVFQTTLSKGFEGKSLLEGIKGKKEKEDGCSL